MKSKSKRVIIAIMSAVIVSAVSAGALIIYKNTDKSQSDKALKLSDVHLILQPFKNLTVSDISSIVTVKMQPFKNLTVSDVDSIMVYECWTNIARVLPDELVSEMVDVLNEVKIPLLPVKDEDAIVMLGMGSRFSMLLKDGRLFEFEEYGCYFVLNKKRYETDERTLRKIEAIYRKKYPIIFN